jgi:hypothetical protein
VVRGGWMSVRRARWVWGRRWVSRVLDRVFRGDKW